MCRGLILKLCGFVWNLIFSLEKQFRLNCFSKEIVCMICWEDEMLWIGTVKASGLFFAEMKDFLPCMDRVLRNLSYAVDNVKQCCTGWHCFSQSSIKLHCIMQILQLFRQRQIANNSLQLFMHRTTGSKQCNLLHIEPVSL